MPASVREEWLSNSHALKTSPLPSGQKEITDTRVFKHTFYKRPDYIKLLASKEQKRRIQRKAASLGIPYRRYILASALGSNYRPPHYNPEWTEALLATNLELTRQGQTLKEIALHLTDKTLSEEKADALLGIITRSILQTHKAVRIALAQGKEKPEP